MGNLLLQLFSSAAQRQAEAWMPLLFRAEARRWVELARWG
jgi:hypothetical protein